MNNWAQVHPQMDFLVANKVSVYFLVFDLGNRILDWHVLRQSSRFPSTYLIPVWVMDCNVHCAASSPMCHFPTKLFFVIVCSLCLWFKDMTTQLGDIICTIPCLSSTWFDGMRWGIVLADNSWWVHLIVSMWNLYPISPTKAWNLLHIVNVLTYVEVKCMGIPNVWWGRFMVVTFD